MAPPDTGGKSTLLNCITSRISGHVTGQVVACRKWRRNSPLDLLLKKTAFFEFTVDKILFSPSPQMMDWPNAQKLQGIFRTLNVTTEAKNRLSKLFHGQMKRTSIAVEMISCVQILFLARISIFTSNMRSFLPTSFFLTPLLPFTECR